MMDNQQKYENYRTQKQRLKKALNQEFYIEAIAIEYSILEDRSESALRHAGIRTTGPKGNPLTLSRKLNKLEVDAAFSSKAVRQKMPVDLLNQIREWKNNRDKLIHALLVLKTDTGQFKTVAEKGNELIKLFDNKVSSVNRYFDKQKEGV